MNIALKANLHNPNIATPLALCLDQLAQRGVKPWVHADLLEFVQDRSRVELIDGEGLPRGTELMLALGGDGTVLGAARCVGETQVPIFAVNLGNFGFLTTCAFIELPECLDRILAGNFTVEERMVLKARVSHADGSEQVYHALNDFVLHKGGRTRPIVLNIQAGGDQVGFFPADGVIVSTPTGSTAYSLSAGGPILFPTMDAVAITPICPHSLAVRPLVVPSDIPLILTEMSAHQEVLLTVDGQMSSRIIEEDVIHVSRAAHVTRMVKPFEGTFFSRLRGKLKWGERERT